MLFCLTTLLFSHAPSSVGQTAEQSGASSEQDEAAKRSQWLKSHFSATRGVGVRYSDSSPTDAAAAAQSSSDKVVPAPAPKEARTAATHKGDAAPAKATSSPSPKVAATKSAASPSPSGKTADKPAASGHHQESVAATNRNSETHPAEMPTPKAKSSTAHSESVADTKRTPEARVAETHPAASPSPKASPTPSRSESVAGTKHNKAADSRTADTHPAATPSPKPNPTPSRTESVASAKRTPDLRIVDTHPTEMPLSRPTLPPPTRGGKMEGRYPWKTGIVTTVFWIGEPVGGNNFTPNCASSWDAHWTQSYGGFDNPNPEARRNFLPANFTPRQNPFYVALPYNDVTRGTTKPEARVVIPWFKEAFFKEGQSVCRDRWVEIRSRYGRVVYAQWSDCGPFRTDHWQYVFGMERPRPNLNGGAGLDVSPAVRDYLGLQSTDMTDWKFVDIHEVPNGPWLLYGDNNPFAQRHSPGSRSSGLAEVATYRH